MELMYTFMALTVILVIRYFLVRYQSGRAIELTHKKTIELIRKCENGLAILHGSKTLDPVLKNKMQTTIIRTVRRAGCQEDLYWAMYYKDFDWNELWLNPMKWTLEQMYPNLMEVVKVEYDIEGKSEVGKE